MTSGYQNNRFSSARLCDRLGISNDALHELKHKVYGDEYTLLKPIVDEIELGYGKVTLSTINEYFGGCKGEQNH